MRKRILTAAIIEGFVGSLLIKKFDSPTPIPDIHREWWDLCTGHSRFVALAAPRGFAKSTAITHSYTLAALLFRERDFALIISGTEAQSIMFLNDIKSELMDNADLKSLFKVKGFLKDSESDIIVEMEDGHKFRLIAKGSEQKLRGVKWAGRRPNLIVCHEKDTNIYTPETGWIKNQDYPGSQLIDAHEAFEIAFENGTTEVVSGDHRYLTDKGWKFAWQLSTADNLCENITDDIGNEILKNERNPSKSITIRTKLEQIVNDGLKLTLIWMLLRKRHIKSVIGKYLMRSLEYTLVKILSGRQLSVQSGALRS